MSRVQLALNVADLDGAIGFYTKLFKTGPAKVRPGYANFAVADPPLKLVLFEGRGEAGAIQRDRVVQPRGEQRRRSAVVLGRAHDHDRIGRALLVELAARPDAIGRIADEQGKTHEPEKDHAPDIARDGTALYLTLRRRPGSGALSDRGTSCTSRPTRTSTGRCARSGHRSG